MLGDVTIHVCGNDGQRFGEFEEAEFRDKIFANALLPDSYYWHEGMADWRPISEYRALAKTQRITIVPPLSRTTKIIMDSGTQSDAKAETTRESFFARSWQRLTNRMKPGLQSK